MFDSSSSREGLSKFCPVSLWWPESCAVKLVAWVLCCLCLHLTAWLGRRPGSFTHPSGPLCREEVASSWCPGGGLLGMGGSHKATWFSAVRLILYPLSAAAATVPRGEILFIHLVCTEDISGLLRGRRFLVLGKHVCYIFRIKISHCFRTVGQENQTGERL